MTRPLAIFVLSLLMTRCSAQSYNPVSQVDIHASAEDQAKIVAATKAFGERQAFEVSSGDSLVKDNRRVLQVDLKRDDGVMITLDNFLRADALQVSFFAKKPAADWHLAKEAWLQDVRAALGNRGEIVEVPVGPQPNLLEKQNDGDN
jgi:hypothetical protein